MSRLPTSQSNKEELFLERRVFEDQVAFPLDLAKIHELQQNDEQLQMMQTKREGKDRFTRKVIQGHNLWTFNDKIFVPKHARAPMVEWYHESLQHAGSERTAKTIRQHFE